MIKLPEEEETLSSTHWANTNVLMSVVGNVVNFCQPHLSIDIFDPPQTQGNLNINKNINGCWTIHHLIYVQKSIINHSKVIFLIIFFIILIEIIFYLVLFFLYGWFCKTFSSNENYAHKMKIKIKKNKKKQRCSDNLYSLDLITEWFKFEEIQISLSLFS